MSTAKRKGSRKSSRRAPRGKSRTTSTDMGVTKNAVTRKSKSKSRRRRK